MSAAVSLCHCEGIADDALALRVCTATTVRELASQMLGSKAAAKKVLARGQLQVDGRRLRGDDLLGEGTLVVLRLVRDVPASVGMAPLPDVVFQDPLTTLNPTIPIGRQIMEAIRKQEKVSREEASHRAMELLDLVGIEDAAHRFSLQPHFFSGGMRQRCVLAIALASNPKLLFADEATTALDVTVEAKILDLLREIRQKTGIAIVFISHDLGAVARIADRVAVMYAGKIVEIGTADEIFYDPRHPYTWGLLSSLPALAAESGELRPIPGMPPSLLDPPPGDAFAERNEYALAIDYEQMPPMFPVSDTHFAATWLLDPRAPRVEPPIRLKAGSGKWTKT